MEPRQAAIETYRYLRVGIVGLATLLLVAVVVQAVSDGGLLDSISAYYYTPVRDVFVGVLVATGLGLIVIRGRGVEDALLNAAGMLAPIVAFVPAVETASIRSQITGVRSAEAPPVADVGTGVWALLALGLAGVAFAALTARRLTGGDRAMAVRGVRLSGLVLVAFALWLVVSPETFARAAHYVAAIGLIGLFVLVARLNAQTASDGDRPVVRMLPAARRRAAYRLTSWSMLAAVVVGALLGLLELFDQTPLPLWLLWVETALLALFTAFWVLQTIEYWRNGVPVD